MYCLKYSSQFKKDLKRVKHDKKFLSELESVLDELVNGNKLDKSYQDHLLSGEFKNCHECHIRPDMLLVYKKEKHELIILLLRVGSHSEIF